MVTTPCIQVCKIAPSGLCEGCGRTLSTIQQWSRMSETERKEWMRKHSK